MDKVRCIAEVQIVNENTQVVVNQPIEVFLEKTYYDKARIEDSIEDAIINCIKNEVYICEEEFINMLRKYEIYSN